MSTPTHITTSGGLISAAFIENVREHGSRQRGVEPASFTLPWAESPKSPAALEETIATAWELLLERWDAVRNDLTMMDVSQVRSRWLLPLFQLLDFDPVYLRGDTILDDAGKLRYPLSHRGWDVNPPQSPLQGGSPVIHTVIPSQDLDGRMAAGRGIKAKSPHDMLQAFLNASPADLWAVLTNGVLLRLLRDYHHTFTKGFVQFDLESIFETRNYGDFRALYRMCHASRFIPPPSPVPTGEGGRGGEGFLPLEQFYKDSIATGIKVGEYLRGQVRQAIETLGNGFLDGELIRAFHGATSDRSAGSDACRQSSNVRRQGGMTFDASRLTQESSDGSTALIQQYYAEILHIVYRILFLLFAEQRGMMPGRDSLYAQSYSIARLRGRAEGDIPREDDFTDLWEGLKVTFRMVREGVPDLSVFGYDGMLFAEDQTLLLDGLSSPSLTSPPAPPLRGEGSSGSPFPCREGGRGLGQGGSGTIANSDLLRAVRALTLIEREGVLQRISYADLGVEELGSIYESLLDFTPHVTTGPEEALTPPAPLSRGNRRGGRNGIPANTFFLDPRGSERKTTGSYYTHPSLVNELIKSALLLVARDRLAEAGLPVIEEEAIGEATAGLLTDYAGLDHEQRAAGEAALLSLKVCDPAAGSGHFLVKANNALGAELARVRSGDEYPAEAQVQAAKRDVLVRCIYGVDLNPMAVELCKVSLWINGSVADKPLSFLDHHIKCGNSLIGATPALIGAGISTDAFKAITGNDRAVVKGVRARNRKELKEWEAGAVQGRLFQVTLYEPDGAVHQEYITIADLAEEQPKVARERYEEYRMADEYRRRKLEADFWTAAFFWPLTEQKPGFSEKPGFFPTHGEFVRLRAEGPEALPPEALAQVEALAERHCFFHWHLEFPDVFADSPPLAGEGPGEGAGFDVVLGNPPWERIKLQEKEFFADKDPAIANARTAAERRRLIHKLPQTNPDLHTAYTAALRQSEATSHFLRVSGRFPLTSGGDINTYAVFAGLARQIVAPPGRAGIVVPTGIATDYTNRDFFADLVGAGQLASLYDFENRRKLFPEVDSRYKFGLLTLTGGGAAEAEFAFFLHTAGDLADPERCFPLAGADLVLMNPNTRTVPVFRARRDADLTRRLYRAAPVLVNEAMGENPWTVSFLRMFDMTNDSHLFRMRDELEAEGFVLEGNRFIRDGEVYLPLYEAKMFWHFDHRFGTYEAVQSRSDTHLPSPSPAQHAGPSFVVQPWYWVNRREVVARLAPDPGWALAFRDITNTTNERTGIFTLVPWAAIANNAPIFILERPKASLISSLLANLSAAVFDFVVRQKIGGTHLNFYIIKQLPVIPPDRYTPELLNFIVPRVVELTYTAWDLQPFAQDVLDEVGPETWARWFQEAPVHTSPPPKWTLAPTPPPFVWNEERRAHLRAELDGLYTHLYGLTRDELAYILDTFPIVRRKDEEKYGEYRTKRLVLEGYDALKGQFG